MDDTTTKQPMVMYCNDVMLTYSRQVSREYEVMNVNYDWNASATSSSILLNSYFPSVDVWFVMEW